MSILPLPGKIRLRLDQIQGNFLWGGASLEREPHLVNWSLVCLSKGVGRGFGMKNLSTLNKALLYKWSWRYTNEKGLYALMS